jgi:sulfatase maturation enzyme AslB (radical SAM superfamily)
MKLSEDLADGRVLFLGNNDNSTDHAVSSLAQQHNTKNHGLITHSNFEPAWPGYYHTTVVDIPWGELIEMSKKFDAVVMLDQPQNQWSHWKCMQATCKMMLQLEELSIKTVFRDNANVKRILYWIDLVYKKNFSMCIYPWINLHNDGNKLKLCSRDSGTVTTVDDLQNWSTNQAYTQIRQSMIEGRSLPDHCSVCYKYEEVGMESYRQFETIDWVTKLEIDSIEDLNKLTRPLFYEVHTGNHCNIKCRGCQPSYSDAIGLELKKFNITPPKKLSWTPQYYPLERINIDELDHHSQVYFQGGEPTIMPEIRDFLSRCIQQDKTNFALTMCTNGVKITDEFLDLIKHFPNTNFSFSIDGYNKVNDYWRSGSQWNRVIANAHRMHSLGYSVSMNTVPGIYNVTNLHLLFEFLDKEFPFTAIYMQVNSLPWQSAYNHPLHELVVQSMLKCQQTSIYHSNGKSCKTSIDSILNHYSNNPVCNLEELRNFFNYNDQLDLARGTKLADYIPELEATRKFIL